MLYQKVKVIRDTNTVYNRAVPLWEIPVLTFIFDPGNVQPTGVFDMVDRPYPDAGSEYDRLVRRYGADAKSGVPHVASVYGSAIEGLRSLGRAIEEAEADEDERKANGTAPKVHYAKVSREVAEHDELMA
jgi:hypothetical protein